MRTLIRFIIISLMLGIPPRLFGDATDFPKLEEAYLAEMTNLDSMSFSNRVRGYADMETAVQSMATPLLSQPADRSIQASDKRTVGFVYSVYISDISFLETSIAHNQETAAAIQSLKHRIYSLLSAFPLAVHSTQYERRLLGIALAHGIRTIPDDTRAILVRFRTAHGTADGLPILIALSELRQMGTSTGRKRSL